MWLADAHEAVDLIDAQSLVHYHGESCDTRLGKAIRDLRQIEVHGR
jgi:hypothetical protein